MSKQILKRVKPQLNMQNKISKNRRVFHYKRLNSTVSLTLCWKWIILQIFPFVLITNLKINIKVTSKIKFWSDELLAIKIVIYQICSLILLVLSKTVRDKYSFTINKSFYSAPFPSCRSLKPTTSLMLYWKRIILKMFSFSVIAALKMKINYS